MSEFPKGINVVVVTPNRRVRNVLTRVVKEIGGIVPVAKSETDEVERAHYVPAISKIIINNPSQRTAEKLGSPSVCVAIEVPDRVAAAYKAVEMFNAAGYEATALTEALEEFPPGFLAFVLVPKLKGIAILFAPRDQDVTPELAVTLRRVPWTDSDDS
jgi:hypothetical protein